MHYVGSALIKWNPDRSFIRVETPYNKKWYSAIKYLLPRGDHAYIGRRQSTFDPKWYPLIKKTCDHYFLGVTDLVEKDPPANIVDDWERLWIDWQRDLNSDTRTEPLADEFDPYATLHLLPSAPEVVVRAAYRALAKIHHTDAGGESEKMVAINRAYDEIMS